MGGEETGTVAPGGGRGPGVEVRGAGVEVRGSRKPEVTPAAPLQHHAGHTSALRQPY